MCTQQVRETFHVRGNKNKKPIEAFVDSTGSCCSEMILLRDERHAACMRLRRLLAAANGTPPMSMANCVASIVMCDWPAAARGISNVPRSRRLYQRIKPPGSHHSALMRDQPSVGARAAIDEQEQVAVEHGHLGRRFDDPAEPIEAFAEIDRLAAEINLRPVWQSQHHASPVVVRAAAMDSMNRLTSS